MVGLDFWLQILLVSVCLFYGVRIFRNQQVFVGVAVRFGNAVAQHVHVMGTVGKVVHEDVELLQIMEVLFVYGAENQIHNVSFQGERRYIQYTLLKVELQMV